MAGRSNGMDTDMCFEIIQTTVTLALTDGTQVGNPTVTTNTFDTPISSDVCCNAGVDNGDVSLQALCGSIETTEANEMLNWDGATCTRMYDSVTTFILTSDGSMAIGSPITTPMSESATQDRCCQSGGTSIDLDLLMACEMITEPQPEFFVWDQINMNCNKIQNVKTNYVLPSDDQVVVHSDTR